MAETASQHPEAVILLFEEAKRTRSSAERARRLAEAITTQDTSDNLFVYAAELEQRAKDLDRLATKLAETIGRTRALSGDISDLIADARTRVKNMTLKPSPR